MITKINKLFSEGICAGTFTINLNKQKGQISSLKFVPEKSHYLSKQIRIEVLSFYDYYAKSIDLKGLTFNSYCDFDMICFDIFYEDLNTVYIELKEKLLRYYDGCASNSNSQIWEEYLKELI